MLSHSLTTVKLLYLKLIAYLQGGTNLDTMRNTTPQLPNAYAPSGTPGAGYEDPKPMNTANFGAIQIKDQTGAYFNSVTGKLSIIYLDPSGVRRDMAQNFTTGLYESYDSSYPKFDATAQIMYFPNGAQMKFGAYSYSVNNRDFQALPIQIKDRNGNFVDIFYKTLDNEKVVIDYFIDTAGRRVDFAYQGNRLVSIGQNRGGTWYYFVRIDYQPITIQTYFDTTLTWNVTGGGASSVQVRAGSPNGTLVASGGTSGNVTTGKWVTNGTVFYLQNVTGGLPLTSEYTLATVTVSTSTQGCPPPVSFNKTINYARNNTGAISGIGTNLIGSDPNATANVTSAMTYRAWNAYHGMNFGNGLRLTVGHNSQRLQMTSFVVDQQNGSSYLWRQYYDYYNGGGNNSRIRRVSDDPTFAVHKIYQYDAYNRLQYVLNSNSPDWHAGYSYDEWGNIRTINSVAGGATLTYQTNATGAPTNRLATANGNNVSYDAAGNQTAMGSTTYGYDAANRLKATGGASNQYGYDGDGKRVRQPGLYYVQSSVLDKVAMEVDANANVQRAYVYLNNKLVALQSTDGNFYWAHSDHLNSGRMLTSTAGSMAYRADFDPFGQVTYEWSASGNNNLNTRKFTGYERDATGLDYAQARTYTSGWGRFTQSDPLGSGFGGRKPNPLGAARTGLPQTLNRYSYVSNDPINKTDPSGLLVRNPEDGCLCCGGGGGDGDGGGGGASSVTVDFRFWFEYVHVTTRQTVCVYHACSLNPCKTQLFDVLPPNSVCSAGVEVRYNSYKVLGITFCFAQSERYLLFRPC